ncbi:hypothetical protein BOX15_Mlig007089g3, partial [Macrostomum lignano]
PRTRSRELAEASASSSISTSSSTVVVHSTSSASNSSSSFLGLLWTEEIQLRRALLRSMRDSSSNSTSGVTSGSDSGTSGSSCTTSGVTSGPNCGTSGSNSITSGVTSGPNFGTSGFSSNFSRRKRTMSESNFSVTAIDNKKSNQKSRISFPSSTYGNSGFASVRRLSEAAQIEPQLCVDPGTGNPVRTGDFLEFLCFHGAYPSVPMPQRLRFFALPPSQRILPIQKRKQGIPRVSNENTNPSGGLLEAKKRRKSYDAMGAVNGQLCGNG